MSLKDEIGKKGEKIAAEYLKSKNYYIIEQNYYSHFGEIDIIAEKNEFTVFIEVKTRSSEDFMPLERTLLIKQKKRMQNAALYYFAENDYALPSLRFDLIAVKINRYNFKAQKIKHFKNIIDSF